MGTPAALAFSARAVGRAAAVVAPVRRCRLGALQGAPCAVHPIPPCPVVPSEPPPGVTCPGSRARGHVPVLSRARGHVPGVTCQGSRARGHVPISPMRRRRTCYRMCARRPARAPTTPPPAPSPSDTVLGERRGWGGSARAEGRHSQPHAQGAITISARSTLVLDGDVTVEHLSLDGGSAPSPSAPRQGALRPRHRNASRCYGRRGRRYRCHRRRPPPPTATALATAADAACTPHPACHNAPPRTPPHARTPPRPLTPAMICLGPVRATIERRGHSMWGPGRANARPGRE